MVSHTGTAQEQDEDQRATGTETVSSPVTTNDDCPPLTEDCRPPILDNDDCPPLMEDCPPPILVLNIFARIDDYGIALLFNPTMGYSVRRCRILDLAFLISRIESFTVTRTESLMSCDSCELHSSIRVASELHSCELHNSIRAASELHNSIRQNLDADNE